MGKGKQVGRNGWVGCESKKKKSLKSNKKHKKKKMHPEKLNDKLPAFKW